MKTLILGLGNDLLGDDAVGILAARALKEHLTDKADIVESSLSGIALLDLLIGYERAIIIDAVQTGKNPPGTIYTLSLGEKLSPAVAQALEKLVRQIEKHIAQGLAPSVTGGNVD